MVDWNALLEDDDEQRQNVAEKPEDHEWRGEAADSLCELYFETYFSQSSNQRIDHRKGSDYQRYLETHMRPLGDHGVWETLFPNKSSATSAQALDEALHLLADSKLVDRIYSGDIVTANKLIQNISKKRAKYLDA